MIVVGAGVIGLELGSVWRRLGAEVTVVEYLDRILPGMDIEICKQFQRLLEKQGVKFMLGSKVSKVENSGKARQGDGRTGRRRRSLRRSTPMSCWSPSAAAPTRRGSASKPSALRLERGQIVIDSHFATNVPGVYAIGDVVRGPMLAHKAEDEGVAVAEILAGQHGHVNYEVDPRRGLHQPGNRLRRRDRGRSQGQGSRLQVGKFPFTANGRARACNHTDGFVKVLADAATDRVLGVHILGFGAGEMIAEAAVLMEFGGSSEDLARTCHAHPTMSEAVREAAIAVEKRAIHT